ncbi:tetratricopeptide repeat protein [Streptococcus halichoeri]|uniref:tetratricopeptide repeat protein n=1 Tax=Streptococcus halichoeri TaxID=254785 RepID=UPI0013585E3C|nr:tetratricopeptide repeat protein [Streptococcus halichoeri]
MLNSEKMLASLDRHDFARAAKYFERALASDPSDSLLALAEYLQGMGYLDDAKRAFEKIRTDYPEANINLAQILAEDGDMDQAFFYLDALPQDDPNYPTALMVMADLYDMEGLADVAHEKLLLASHYSQDTLILLGLAELEMELERYQEAITHYAALDNREILAQTGLSTYERIGKAYAHLGKFEAAIEFLEKALSIEYEDSTALALATLYFEQEEYQKANLYFKQVDTINPAYPGYEWLYAQSLHHDLKPEEALRVVQQGLRKNAFDSQLLLLGSQLAFETHDPQLAEDYLLKAKEVADDLEEIELRLSSLYLDQERYEDLIALDHDQLDQVLTKWNIAKAYHALDQEQALFAYQALAPDLQTNPEFLQEYAYILREFGHLQDAAQVVSAYLALVPDDINMQALRDQLE